MRHPLTLTAELVLKGRKEAAGSRIYAPRPDGELVWLHIALPAAQPFAAPLIERLLAVRPEVSFLVTTSGTAAGLPEGARIITVSGLPDSARAAKAFIAHFAPDIGLWAGGNLAAPPLAAAAEADVPMALIAVAEDGVPPTSFRWRTSVTTALLRYFSAIYAETANAERRLAGYDIDPETLRLTGPMQIGTTPPDCRFDDLDTLREQLQGRGLWAAVHVDADEVEPLIDAHIRAARYDPRALLVLHTRATDVVDRIATARSLVVADWDNGDMPGEPTHILMSRDPGEVGLWHRLAPVTFLGASMQDNASGVSPWAAAALGSAILVGPHVGGYADAYTRLQQAGAARVVHGVEDVATAVMQLRAPDRAAAMAHAGWQIATSGAEATDKVVDLVQDTLDESGGR